MTLELDKQIKLDAWEYLKYNTLGNRDKANGNKTQQFVGLVGEMMVKKIMNIPHVNSNGFDGGFDIEYKGMRIDVKTMSRSVNPKPHYVSNFIAYQENYNCDAYIFASINKKKNLITICGWITKDELRTLGNRYNKGDIRKRDNGTEFKTKAPLIEIKNSYLKPFNKLIQ